MNGRIKHNRAKSALTSRLGGIMQRRRGEEVTQTAGVSLKSGQLIRVPADALPASEILSKARSLGRPHRPGEYLHVSDLVSRCVRKVALVSLIGHQPKPQALSLWDSLTYAQGDAVHDVVKARLALGASEQMWGLWTCACKTTATTEPTTLSAVNADQRCPSCRGPVNVYKELSLFDHEHKVVGNPDVLTLVPAMQALHVSEIKSMAHEAWKDLGRPVPDHVIQVLFYWYLLRHNGYSVTNRVSLIYVSKGWQFSGQPWKEFTLDAEAGVARLAPYLASAMEMVVSKSGGALPQRLAECASANTTRAKNCEVCQTCFGVSNEFKPVQVSISQALKGEARPASTVVRRRRIP